MAALAELNRTPPFRRSPPPNAKLSASAHASPDDDDDEDWAALEAAAEADAAERAAQMMGDEAEDVDMDVLRELEAQEREADAQLAGGGRGAGGGAFSKAAGDASLAKSGGSVDATRERKGKGRMLLEEDDDFGAFGEEGVAGPAVPAKRALFFP